MTTLQDQLQLLQQRTGSNAGCLTTEAERCAFVVNVRTDLASLIAQLNTVYYPLVASLSSEPNLDALDLGLSGNVIFTHVNATATSAPVYWNSSSERAKTIKETVDSILSEISTLENEIDRISVAVAYDDTAIQNQATTNALNLLQLRRDAMGANYVFGGDGNADLTYSLSQHLDALGAFFSGYPGTGNTYTPTYPALSLDIQEDDVAIKYETFVYVPGGTATGNRYTDWATLWTEASAQADLARVRIFIDDTNGAATIPAGSYDFDNIILSGASNTTIYTPVTIASSVTITNLRWIDHIEINHTVAETPITYTSDGGLFINSCFLHGSGGASELISVSGSSTLTIIAHGGTIFGGSSIDVIALAASTDVVNLSIRDGSSLNDDVFDGPASSTVNIGAWAGSSVNTIQTNFAGTLTVTEQSQAALIAYDNSGTGIAADTVQAAVTEIDARLSPGTDGHKILDITGGVAVSGTWNITTHNSQPALVRTASTGTESYQYVIDIQKRPDWRIDLGTATIHYSVETADLDDVLFIFQTQIAPADNSGTWTATTAGGDVNGDYDTAHDTAAERGDDTGAPEYHTCTVDLSGSSVSQNDRIRLEVQVDGDAGGAGIFRLYDVSLGYTEAYTG